jgi:ribosome-associated protein
MAAAPQMPRKPVKKSSAKSSPVKLKKTKTSPARKPAKKKTASARVPAKEISEKERALRAANLIANTEKKKKPATKRPKKHATAEQTSSLLDSIVEGMQEKKARNITVLNLSGIENRVTDYFVISDAESRTHVNSIAESVEEIVFKKANERAYHSEGQHNGEWILLDYINVVAHVFLREAREHYNLEGLWGDAEITEVTD